MLYDNAQLISLYSAAWQVLGDPLYREVVYETTGFVNRELCSGDGMFYSALDADSEGVEGNFRTMLEKARKKLWEAREKRIRPALDNKVIVSWNALMIKSLSDAYAAFQDPVFLERAMYAESHFSLPGTLLAASTRPDYALSVFANRYVEGQTRLYVCSMGVCKQPVDTVQEALQQLDVKAG